MRVKENLLARIWRGQWLSKGELFTNDGRKVKVLSPGRENHEEGPDFLDASLLLDNELVRGDIELHLRSRDWRVHGHHHDPRYNGVILQVVLFEEEQKPALLSSGKIIPTLVLQDYLDGSLEELSLRQIALPFTPCWKAAKKLDRGRMKKILDQAGEERFYLKAASFEVELILEEAPEVLYRGIMRALGYAKNKGPFQELARHLPLSVLESLSQERGERKLTLQAVLLGAAGLLPSQYGKGAGLEEIEPVERMEGIWKSLELENVLNGEAWHFFRVRPQNFPTRRLLAAGYLLDRYLEKGLFRGMLSLIEHANPHFIEDGLTIHTGKEALLGRDHAREIIVNIVLPFFLAWAELNSQLKLRERALEIYTKYPGLKENQITRYMKELLWGKAKPARSAQQKQGLIHLYKTFCLSERCQICPLNPR